MHTSTDKKNNKHGYSQARMGTRTKCAYTRTRLACVLDTIATPLESTLPKRWTRCENQSTCKRWRAHTNTAKSGTV